MTIKELVELVEKHGGDVEKSYVDPDDFWFSIVVRSEEGHILKTINCTNDNEEIDEN